ncbi:hypothetical protein Tco_1330922 [Tanacetum coccineum]
MRNEDLRTELEYFSEEFDEERVMKLRLASARETTPVLRKESPREVNLPPLLASQLRRNDNGLPLQSSLTSLHGGYQPLVNAGGNLPPNGTHLSDNAQPFIPNSLQPSSGPIPTYVNPYPQPNMGVAYGQPLSYLSHAQGRNPTFEEPPPIIPMGDMPHNLL